MDFFNYWPVVSLNCNSTINLVLVSFIVTSTSLFMLGNIHFYNTSIDKCQYVRNKCNCKDKSREKSFTHSVLLLSGQLAVQSIDMCQQVNKPNHYTTAYDTHNLVIRRGQEFIVRVTFNRPPAQGDDFQLEFLIGESSPRFLGLDWTGLPGPGLCVCLLCHFQCSFELPIKQIKQQHFLRLIINN